VRQFGQGGLAKYTSRPGELTLAVTKSFLLRPIGPISLFKIFTAIPRFRHARLTGRPASCRLPLLPCHGPPPRLPGDVHPSRTARGSPDSLPHPAVQPTSSRHTVWPPGVRGAGTHSGLPGGSSPGRAQPGHSGRACTVTIRAVPRHLGMAAAPGHSFGTRAWLRRGMATAPWPPRAGGRAIPAGRTAGPPREAGGTAGQRRHGRRGQGGEQGSLGQPKPDESGLRDLYRHGQ